MMYPGCTHHLSKGKEKRIFFTDIETTGFAYYKNELLTLSASVYSYPPVGPMLSEINLKLRPMHFESWEDSAEEVHKIGKLEAALFEEKKPQLEQFMGWLREWEGPAGAPLLCSHAQERKGGSFDFSMLMADCDQLGMRFDLMNIFPRGSIRSTITYLKHAVKEGRLSASLFYDPEKKKESYRLAWACKALNIEMGTHHDARYDRISCEKIYQLLHGLEGNFGEGWTTEVEF